MINRLTLSQEAIDYIKRLGYRVYMRDRADSYALYCDDVGNIAYVQYEPIAGYTVSSVHKPNRFSGTGYQIARHADALTEDILATALRTTVPGWHRGDRVPLKYKGIDDYRASDSFKAAFAEV